MHVTQLMVLQIGWVNFCTVEGLYKLSVKLSSPVNTEYWILNMIDAEECWLIIERKHVFYSLRIVVIYVMTALVPHD